MGVNLRDLIPEEAVETIELNQLRGKTLAIDAYNALYQFLSIIRQPNGTPLKDSKGRITSHLSGLFYRTVNFLEAGIKPVYVFDGTPPEIKELEIERRKKIKKEAAKRYEEALKKGDLEAARTYAQQTATLTEEMVNDAKRLLDALGIPWVQAPSEGEAQAAYMAIKGDVWATASQDYDSLLFGTPILVRNLGIESRLYYPKRGVFVKLNPEVIVLSEVLRVLKINRRQLIDIALLIGTDYNEGVKGIGPRKALKLIRLYGSIERVLRIMNLEVDYDVDELRNFFLNPPVTDDYGMKLPGPKLDELSDFLLSRDFNPHRVNRALSRLEIAYRSVMSILEKQSDMLHWLGS